MKLEAQLTHEDVSRVFGWLTPVRVALDSVDPGRYLFLNQPSRVDLVDDDALHVTVSGRLQWDVVGIKLPVDLRMIALRVAPVVEQQQGHDVLVFGLQVDSLDVSALPGFVEHELVARINQALRAIESKLAWHFTETLDLHLRMPISTTPRRTVRLCATHGVAKVTPNALIFGSEFELDIQPRDTDAAQPSSAGERKAAIVAPTPLSVPSSPPSTERSVQR